MISKERAFEEHYKEVSFLKSKNETKYDYRESFVFEDFIKTKQGRMKEVLSFLRSMEELQKQLETNISICLKEQGCYENAIKVIINNSTFLFSHFLLNKDYIIKHYAKYYDDNSNEYIELIDALETFIKTLSNKIFTNNQLIYQNKHRPLRLNDESLEYNHDKRLLLFSQYRRTVDSLSSFYNRNTKDAFIYSQSVRYSISLIEEIQRDMNIHNNTERVRRNLFYDFFIKKYFYFILEKIN